MNQPIDPNAPAYPQDPGARALSQITIPPGMSIRTAFIMAAMQGFAASGFYRTHEAADYLPDHAVKLADATIAAANRAAARSEPNDLRSAQDTTTS